MCKNTLFSSSVKIHWEAASHKNNSQTATGSEFSSDENDSIFSSFKKNMFINLLRFRNKKNSTSPAFLPKNLFNYTIILF